MNRGKVIAYDKPTNYKILYNQLLDENKKLREDIKTLKAEIESYKFKKVVEDVDEELSLRYRFTDCSRANENRELIENGRFYSFLYQTYSLDSVEKLIGNYGYDKVCKAIKCVYEEIREREIENEREDKDE